MLTSDEKTPNRLTWTDRRTEFEIVVKLPHQSGSPVLRVPRLEIFTPDFSVAISGTDKFVQFHKLTIHTSGMPVVVDVSLACVRHPQSSANRPFSACEGYVH